METFLVLNGWEIAAGVDEQEQVVLKLAAGTLKREDFTAWVQSRVQQRSAESLSWPTDLSKNENPDTD